MSGIHFSEYNSVGNRIFLSIEEEFTFNFKVFSYFFYFKPEELFLNRESKHFI